MIIMRYLFVRAVSPLLDLEYPESSFRRVDYASPRYAPNFERQNSLLFSILFPALVFNELRFHNCVTPRCLIAYKL